MMDAIFLLKVCEEARVDRNSLDTEGGAALRAL